MPGHLYRRSPHLCADLLPPRSALLAYFGSFWFTLVNLRRGSDANPLDLRNYQELSASIWIFGVSIWGGCGPR